MHSLHESAADQLKPQAAWHCSASGKQLISAVLQGDFIVRQTEREQAAESYRRRAAPAPVPVQPAPVSPRASAQPRSGQSLLMPGLWGGVALLFSAVRVAHGRSYACRTQTTTVC